MRGSELLSSQRACINLVTDGNKLADDQIPLSHKINKNSLRVSRQLQGSAAAGWPHPDPETFSGYLERALAVSRALEDNNSVRRIESALEGL